MTKRIFEIFIPFTEKRFFILLKTFLVCIFMVFSFTNLPASAGSVDTIRETDRLYAEGTLESLKLSVKKYKQIAESVPGSYQAFWKGARSCRAITKMAIIHELNNLEKLCVSYGSRGMEMAQDAIRLNPEGVEGHYYYAVNLGGYARGVSIWTILREGLKDKARDHLQKAYKINKGYDDFALVMHMGLYYELLPWFAGQDKGKALEHYREALRLMPEDGLYRAQLNVLAGKLMLDMGVEENTAKKILRRTAESDVDYFSGKAKEILAEHG